MNKLLLSLCLLTGISFNLAAQCPVDAASFQKKLHLAPGELYYVSKADMVSRYAKVGTSLTFPNNHIYDAKGTELLALWTTGTKYPLFTCFQTMGKELDSFALQTPGYTAVADTGSINWAKEHMQPAFEGTPMPPLSKYNIVMYYPAGMPTIGKKYKSFIKQVHAYQKQGKELNVYVVLVPIMKK